MSNEKSNVMNSSSIVAIFFLLNSLPCLAQYQSDSITVKKGLGTTFLQNDRRLKPKELLVITKANPAAFKEMKIAKSNYDASSVFGFVGGFLVGWPIGTALGGGEPNWTMAGIGAGLIVVSIPFSSAYSKRAKNAIGIYNGGLRGTTGAKVKFNLGLTHNGLSLKMRF
jgi:hypothetical protein